MPVIGGHRCTKVTRRAHATLTGTRGNDVLCALGGFDTVIGGSGNDILIGRGGHDTASFKDHTTALIASLATGLETDPTIHQTDHLIGISNLTGGKAGNDLLVGNAANNVLTAGGGNDVLEGGAGNDTLIGGPGHDWLVGGNGHDHMRGGSGHNVIDASQGTDSVDCGTGTAVVNTDATTTEAPDCQGNGDQSQNLQHYHGTVSAIDTTANTITVQWSEVNDTAQTWLDANKDPNPVTISLVGANIQNGGDGHGDGGGQGGGDALPADSTTTTSTTTSTTSTTTSTTTTTTMPATTTTTTTGPPGPTGGAISVGDQVEVEANTSPDGTSLVALDVHTEPNWQNNQHYHGTVNAIDTTANTITVQWTEVNDTAQTWLDGHGDPNPVTISLAGANIESGGRGNGNGDSVMPADAGGGGGGPIQAGDQVGVEAITSADGKSLTALNVHAEANHQEFQDYQGSVTAVDTTANTVTVQWTEANDAAKTWLASNGNLNPVTISLVGANIERHAGLPVQTGDQIELEATPNTAGTGLIAVNVHAEPPGG